jgi:membrane protein implicated in regulation of membrane protease activity
MTVWDTAKALSGSALATGGRSAKIILAAVILAIAVTALVPVALIVGVILMVLGNVLVGLAVIGASVLLAILVFSIAAAAGLRYVRRLLPGRAAGLQDLSNLTNLLSGLSGQAAQPSPQDGHRVVHLDKEEYKAE